MGEDQQHVKQDFFCFLKQIFNFVWQQDSGSIDPFLIKVSHRGVGRKRWKKVTSINDVTEFRTFFDTPYPHRYAFFTEALVLFQKILDPPPPPKKRDRDIIYGQSLWMAPKIKTPDFTKLSSCYTSLSDSILVISVNKQIRLMWSLWTRPTLITSTGKFLLFLVKWMLAMWLNKETDTGGFFISATHETNNISRTYCQKWLKF